MERLRPFLLIVVPGMLLLAEAIRDEEMISTQGIVGDADTEPDDDVGDSAAFMVVVERADGARYCGSLVSARTALTSAQCTQSASATRPLWVRAQSGSARRVLRVAMSTGSTVNLALLELETALGPPARPILVPTISSECAAPAACYVVRIESRRLRIADEQLVAAEVCVALGSRSLDDVLCLRGTQSCRPGVSESRSDGNSKKNGCGDGVVCAGKLCGVVGESANAGCGTPHVAAALSRHRRFLQCAHRQGACARGGECEHLCTETLLIDDEYITVAEVSSLNFKSTPKLLPTFTDGPVKLVSTGTCFPRRTSTGAGGVSWVMLSAESLVPSLRRGSVPFATRTESHVAPSRSPSLGAASSPDVKEDSTTRLALVFEPNRPDFKAGEYGDNAVEYGGEEAGPLARTTLAALAAPCTASTTSTTTASPGRVPADIAARVSPAEASSALRRFPCAELVPVALLLLLPITHFIQYIVKYLWFFSSSLV